MNVYDGRIYNDDRLFILDLCQTNKGKAKIWTVVTRRNCRGFPPFRVDEFPDKDNAVAFIKRIEPTTPLINLEGQSPEKPLDYDAYCQKLMALGLPTSLEIYEVNRDRQREIVVEEVTREEMETEP